MADESPEGRRIIIAVVTGEVGERIAAWRAMHDPEQARRIPPHTTLCYWAPPVAPHALEPQIRHAFPAPLVVRLGQAQTFDNRDRTFYVDVRQTDALDAARGRLYDGNHLPLAKAEDWTWHVTCVRRSRGRDLDALTIAARSLDLDCIWRIDAIAYMELQGDRYEALEVWRL